MKSLLKDYVETLISELSSTEDASAYIAQIDKLYAEYGIEELSELTLSLVDEGTIGSLRKVISNITLRYLSSLGKETRDALHESIIIACEERVYSSINNVPLVDNEPMGTYIFKTPSVFWYYAIGHIGWRTTVDILSKYYK